MICHVMCLDLYQNNNWHYSPESSDFKRMTFDLQGSRKCQILTSGGITGLDQFFLSLVGKFSVIVYTQSKYGHAIWNSS